MVVLHAKLPVKPAKIVDASAVLAAADTLRDFEPDIQRGPGRKLGL